MGNFKIKDIVMAAIPQSKPVRAEVLRLMRQWDSGETYEIRILTGSMRFNITHISADGMTLVERDGKPV
jgi:hypothetical protein